MGDNGGPTAEDFGGTTLPNGIRFHGWRIETAEGPIASAAELKVLKQRLVDCTSTDAPLPKLPEAIFAANKLSMTHEASGAQISFDAEGALTQWLQNSLANGASGLTVPAAALGSWKEKVEKQTQKTGDVGRREWDWTYTSEYAGKGTAADGAPLGWAAHAGAGIDMALLRKREPILFYAELPLYESDLCDSGASESRVRIRVMPSCLFILLRHWLRIDGVLIKQYDARFFVRFDRGGGVEDTPRPGAGVSSPAATLIRLRRLAQAPLPPLPKELPEDDAGRMGGGGVEDTPRPPVMIPPAFVPNEQASSEKLAAITPEHEITEELVLGAATSGGLAGLSIS